MTSVAQKREDVELAERFAGVARALLGELDVDATLRRICELAVDTVGACEAAGISLVRKRRIENLSTTNELPRIVDTIQSDTQEGPCIDAITEHDMFLTGRLSQERRWPEFSRQAYAETGVESILAVRLFAAEDTMGALNLYSTQMDAFDDHDIAVASVFAAHAAVAISGAERQAQLEEMAASRDIIGMAKGIIMACQHVSDDEAFDILRRASQRMNVKLREVADQVVNPPTIDKPAEDTPAT
jgi:GAF domain-containing protein